MSAPAEVRTGGRQMLVVTLVLAVLLLGLGGIAYSGGQLLDHALRPETSADVAALVCTSYKTQNYSQIAGRVDMTPSPTYPGNYDTQALIEQLRALDAANGTVSACSYQLISANDEAALYTLTLQRTKMPVPMGVVLVLHHRDDGTWIISRESNFTGQPPH